MTVTKMTNGIRRVSGRGSSRVVPGEFANTYDISLYLNGEPDNEWIEEFEFLAAAEAVSLRYKPHAGQPAVMQSEVQDDQVENFISVATQFLISVNDRRTKRAESAAEEQRRLEQRLEDAQRIAQRIDQMS